MFKPSGAAKASNSPLFGRTKLVARLQQAAVAKLPLGAQPPSNLPSLLAFLPNLKWAEILKDVFEKKVRPFPSYGVGTDGIYTMKASSADGKIKVSLIGDWGTGTKEAWEVGNCVSNSAPDYAIHLGDVYYMGSKAEVDENFIGVNDQGCKYDAVKFPTGKKGTLALPGNHDLYTGGGPYFSHIIGQSGFCTINGQKQMASFFSLETDSWRVIGIDTGYNSVGRFLIGGVFPFNKIPWMEGDCALDQRLINWLTTSVKPQENKKATIILSHHQYYSVYETAYPKPARQLASLFKGQEVVWIWGHEHRLSIYEKYSPDGNVTCYGRCLGNGGMPVKSENDPSKRKAPLAYFDPRGTSQADGSQGQQYEIAPNTYAGWNGYANLTFDKSKVTIEYLDLNSQLLFSEEFTAGARGSITYGKVQAPWLKPV